MSNSSRLERRRHNPLKCFLFVECCCSQKLQPGLDIVHLYVWQTCSRAFLGGSICLKLVALAAWLISLYVQWDIAGV